MGRISEKPSSHSRHIDGQQAHEKMLSVTNHQGNSSQSRSELPPPACQDDYHQKATDKTSGWLSPKGHR